MQYTCALIFSLLDLYFIPTLPRTFHSFVFSMKQLQEFLVYSPFWVMPTTGNSNTFSASVILSMNHGICYFPLQVK